MLYIIFFLMITTHWKESLRINASSYTLYLVVDNYINFIIYLKTVFIHIDTVLVDWYLEILISCILFCLFTAYELLIYILI